ncbi:bifunctional phosphoribosylaminoimidazolecarboxamide formyltransferase/IMP cyclohydrolase [bacterium]|nr:bifunctional phosphoribosylaminoimidazolecarboxamide formyltransferase/IMP cyclohydrolase [bacterium]
MIDEILKTDIENTEKIQIKRALISSWRKEQAVILAQGLTKLGISIIASGGTADAISKSGIEVEPLSKKTGFDKLLDGRVKTLHPAVYAAILARRDSKSDLKDLEQFQIEPIDLVAVDLYPFQEGLKPDQGADVELIDIGGVSLIRAAAKNYCFVSVLSRAEQFEDFIINLLDNEGEITIDYNLSLSADAFRWTSEYDGLIAKNLDRKPITETLPSEIQLQLRKEHDLRYGENPHQQAAIYSFSEQNRCGIPIVEQLGGKQLSFNNLLDLDIAMRMPREFDQPAVAILKHTTPCGVGIGDTVEDAFLNALSTDPQSAYGSIVGFNRKVDFKTAKALRKGFVEVVCAPDYTEDALNNLLKSKNLRIIRFNGEIPNNELDYRSVWGGILVESKDFGFPEFDDIKIVTNRKPTKEQLEALKFAWKSVRYVKSNAILIADNHRTVGIGAGQMSRVDAAYIAVWKAGQAGLSLQDTVAASDAFFPFRDGLDMLVDAGIIAIIQPGGSIRDEEVIEAANERDIVMMLTGRRHFRH